MAGFFDLGVSLVGFERGDEPDLKMPIHDCESCGLFANCKTPKAGATGVGKKRILVIGGAMTSYEDKENNQKHGSVYKNLQLKFKEMGIDMVADCWYTHAIRCYSKDKKFGRRTMSGCHAMLMKEIARLNPAVIVPTNSLAWDVLLYDRMAGRAANNSFFDYAGMTIPDQVLNAWVLPIYDPELIALYEEDKYNKFLSIWEDQIKSITDFVDVPVPKHNYEDRVRVSTNREDSIRLLNQTVVNWKEWAFDYETTCIKPNGPNSEITCVSFSNGKETVAVLWEQNDPEFMGIMKKLFTGPARKIAHNGSFEQVWTYFQVGVDVRITDDPMILFHAYNNQKPTSLKYLTYSYLGIVGYDRAVDEYIKSTTEDQKIYGSYAVNNMKKAPKVKSLTYCALDSLFTYWLCDMLLPMLHKSRQLPGYRFFMDAQESLAWTTINGMYIDMDLINKITPEITEKYQKYKEKVINHRLIRKVWDWSSPFNPKSDQHVRHLLYDLEGIKPTTYTDKGAPSVDEETISKFKGESPIVADLLEFRRWHKLLHTYIGQFKAEAMNGKIHPFFPLNGVKTYRSSSRSPNFQNIPKRDKEIKKIIRSTLKAAPGHKIKEYDFKSAEVCIAAAVTRDPNLVKYVSDLSTDMHLDSSVPLFMVESKKVNKALRNVTKNAFVFASFYGSYWKQTAADIWEQIDVSNPVDVFGFDVVAHLRASGIHTYEDWEAHVMEQERILWEDRFPDYQKFRENTFKSFMNYGFIDYPNGFRYMGPATRNEVLNSPVQGPAFHVQLWAFDKVCRILREQKFNSFPMGQIHDAMVLSVDPAEEALVDRLIWEYATQKVKEHWTYINIPLVLEHESSPVGGSWADMIGGGYLQF